MGRWHPAGSKSSLKIYTNAIKRRCERLGELPNCRGDSRRNQGLQRGKHQLGSSFSNGIWNWVCWNYNKLPCCGQVPRVLPLQSSDRWRGLLLVSWMREDWKTSAFWRVKRMFEEDEMEKLPKKKRITWFFLFPFFFSLLWIAERYSDFFQNFKQTKTPF